MERNIATHTFGTLICEPLIWDIPIAASLKTVASLQKDLTAHWRCSRGYDRAPLLVGNRNEIVPLLSLPYEEMMK